MTRNPKFVVQGALTLILAAATAVSCTAPTDSPGAASEANGEAAVAGIDLEVRARELARELVIADTHIDIPYRLQEEPADIAERTDGGDFDYPRAIEGGLDAAFMSIYIPASYQESGGARELADELIDMVEGFERAAPERFAVVTTPDEIEALHGSGRIALPMGMENGAPIETLEDLAYFHGRGIRYVTLTHSRNNKICDSSYAEERQWGGLSPFGREVVAEMNRLGVLIDISHVSDAAAEQVLELTRAPVIASHSSARKFTPGWERNMSDELIEKLAANGGVLHVNFGSSFLTETAWRQSQGMWEAAQGYAEEHALSMAHPDVRAYMEKYNQDNPLQLADVTDVADHIDHIVAIAGIDHVGLGSDFDGVGPTTPTGLKDVSQYPNLIRVLLERGYSDEEIAKITWGNLARAWRRAEAVARELQAGGS